MSRPHGDWHTFSNYAAQRESSDAVMDHWYDAVGLWAYSDENKNRVLEKPAPTQCVSCPVTAMVGAVAMTRAYYPIRKGMLCEANLQDAHKLMLELYKGPWAGKWHGTMFDTYVEDEPPYIPADLAVVSQDMMMLCEKPERYESFFSSFSIFLDTPGYLHGRREGYHPIGAPGKWGLHDFMMGKVDRKPTICELCAYSEQIKDLLVGCCYKIRCADCTRIRNIGRDISSHYKRFQDFGMFK